jgi:arginine/lysine/ornithine decarboxylase
VVQNIVKTTNTTSPYLLVLASLWIVARMRCQPPAAEKAGREVVEETIQEALHSGKDDIVNLGVIGDFLGKLAELD